MDLGLKGETALCLAASQGLGFACAKALVEAGVKVVINGRNVERGKKAAASLGNDAAFVAADLTSDTDRARLFDEAKRQLGHISILITNADGPQTGPFLDRNLDDWRKGLELTMLPAIDMAQRCVPDMTTRKFGRIINISSISAKEPTPNTPLANSLKLGLIGAMATLAREVARQGVTVNNILPGPFDTDLLRRVAPFLVNKPEMPQEDAVKLYGERAPVGRIGQVAEFGALCAFLASRHAGYMTGQSVVIDGGHVHAIY